MTDDAESVLTEMGITLADVGSVLPVLVKTAKWYANRKTEAHKRERDELFRDWVVEHHRALADHLKRLDALDRLTTDTIARLEALVEDPEFCRVQANYGFEAAREAIDERRTMLAHADAGSTRLDLSIAHLARVERTIRELDPDDVKLLARLARYQDETEAQQAQRFHHANNRYLSWSGSQPSGHILAASGCVHLTPAPVESPTVGQGLDVTELGRWVLKVLDGYLRSQKPDEPTPPQNGAK